MGPVVTELEWIVLKMNRNAPRTPQNDTVWPRFEAHTWRKEYGISGLRSGPPAATINPMKNRRLWPIVAARTGENWDFAIEKTLTALELRQCPAPDRKKISRFYPPKPLFS